MRRLRSNPPSTPAPGRDPINTPMINNWVGRWATPTPSTSTGPLPRAAGHPGIVCPTGNVAGVDDAWPAQGPAPEDPFRRVTELFDAAGCTSVVATNCDTVYHRYTRVGEQVTLSGTHRRRRPEEHRPG